MWFKPKLHLVLFITLSTALTLLIACSEDRLDSQDYAARESAVRAEPEEIKLEITLKGEEDSLSARTDAAPKTTSVIQEQPATAGYAQDVPAVVNTTVGVGAGFGGAYGPGYGAGYGPGFGGAYGAGWAGGYGVGFGGYGFDFPGFGYGFDWPWFGLGYPFYVGDVLAIDDDHHNDDHHNDDEQNNDDDNNDDDIATVK